jgi:ABC-type branched-subunit amino acid transport system ATPase component
MTSSAPALDVEGVSVTFGGVQALKDVTLSVAHGRRVGLIGPNGAGKTTLVNCVAGGLTPHRGDVRLSGESVSRIPQPVRARAGVGRTFQNLELFATMTVLENVVTALDHVPRRASARQKRELARTSLATFGIDGYADVAAGSLPYGVRKLVELSRAFVREPRFLLLDEPVAGMNKPEAFLDALVEGLDQLGCAVLLVEHDMPTVRRLCEEIYVLDSGAVIAHGDFATVAADPRVVEAYLGTDAVPE